MVHTRVRKYTVTKDELKITEAGLYAVFPYERLDESHKGVFKVGYTGTDFISRIESYHSYYPSGVYITFFMAFPAFEYGQGKAKQREMETQLFKRLKEAGGKMLEFPSRPAKKSEWYYCSFAQLRVAFLAVQAEYGGDLKEYSLSKLNGQFAKNMRKKNKFVGETIIKTR